MGVEVCPMRRLVRLLAVLFVTGFFALPRAAYACPS